MRRRFNTAKLCKSGIQTPDSGYQFPLVFPLIADSLNVAFGFRNRVGQCLELLLMLQAQFGIVGQGLFLCLQKTFSGNQVQQPGWLCCLRDVDACRGGVENADRLVRQLARWNVAM